MKHTGKRILAVLTAVMLLAGSFSFAGFADDGTHTHQYTAIVVEPGYLNGGYTQHVCSCGDTYTDTPTSTLTQPTCEMTGGSVIPGQSVTIEARMHNCNGLQNLTLDLAYNEYWLTLTGVTCTGCDAPERVSNKALYFAAAGSALDQAVLYLTFAVRENAPVGSQTVSLSGCGVSAYAADNGGNVLLTAQDATLRLYKPVKLAVTAPTGTVAAGETVQMTVDLLSNSGLAGMAFDLHYDPQVLTLTRVQQSGMLSTGSVVMSGTLSMMPFRVLWDDATAMQNHTEIGTILTLTFAVKDSAAAGTTDVWVTFDPGEMLNMQLQPVETVAESATLTIVRRLSGDADCDGDVDLKDVVCISRYLAGGWGVTADPRNSDVNADGRIDLKDVILVRRYLSEGWDVVLI